MEYTEAQKISEFVCQNIHCDPVKLRLKWHNRVGSLPPHIDLAITQIECRQRTSKKLPTLNADPLFMYPSTLSAEQCTSEPVAQLHAQIVGKATSMIDLTAGLCVDAYYIAANVKHVVAVERDSATAEISRYNMRRMRPNIEVVCTDCRQYLADIVSNNSSVDVIFIDPARRNTATSRRVFGLNDCEPDVTQMLPMMARIARRIYVKTSPMLDIQMGIKQLVGTTDVRIIAIRNECRELFFALDTDKKSEDITLHCININADGKLQTLAFKYGENDTCLCLDPNEPIGEWIYEPNAAIMKATAFAPLQKLYAMPMLTPMSHLFTSNTCYSDFPGRRYRVIGCVTLKSREMNSLIPTDRKANVTVRNFPLTAPQLTKFLKVVNGGNTHIIGTTTANGSHILIFTTLES